MSWCGCLGFVSKPELIEVGRRLVVVGRGLGGCSWTYRLPKELVPLAIELSVNRQAENSCHREEKKPSLGTLQEDQGRRDSVMLGLRNNRLGFRGVCPL